MARSIGIARNWEPQIFAMRNHLLQRCLQRLREGDEVASFFEPPECSEYMSEAKPHHLQCSNLRNQTNKSMAEDASVVFGASARNASWRDNLQCGHRGLRKVDRLAGITGNCVIAPGAKRAQFKSFFGKSQHRDLLLFNWSVRKGQRVATCPEAAHACSEPSSLRCGALWNFAQRLYLANSCSTPELHERSSLVAQHFSEWCSHASLQWSRATRRCLGAFDRNCIRAVSIGAFVGIGFAQLQRARNHS